MERVIDDAGAGDYTLVVTGSGEVQARKEIPFDGVRYYSTEDRPNSSDKTSEFQLDHEEVVSRYAERSGTTTPTMELVDDVQRALNEVCDDSERAVTDGSGMDAHRTAPHSFRQTVSVDVCVGAETWARIYAATRENYQAGQDPVTAFENAVARYIDLDPVVLVGCESKGPADIDGLPAETEVDDE